MHLRTHRGTQSFLYSCRAPRTVLGSPDKPSTPWSSFGRCATSGTELETGPEPLRAQQGCSGCPSTSTSTTGLCCRTSRPESPPPETGRCTSTRPRTSSSDTSTSSEPATTTSLKRAPTAVSSTPRRCCPCSR
nr:hypothetical protein [Bat mastadenovirus BtSY2]